MLPGMIRNLLALLIAVALAAVGCSGAGSGTSDPPAVRPDVEAWQTIALRDVRTQETFRIADLRGKLVAIEAIAIWCANCKTQQAEAAAAIAEIGSPDLVYISLDVDPNEQEADLAEYARREGFDWRFAVASPDVARSLVAAHGPQVLSPPATPVILVAPDGRVIEVQTGIRSADELVADLRAHLP